MALIRFVEEAFQPGTPSGSFINRISRSVIVPSSQQVHKTLIQYAPDHKVTDEFRELAKEFETRLENRDGEEKTEGEVDNG